jgi:branched-chain amino acid transport system ATP-binding protein
VCHVPEGRGLFPSLSVRENLVLFSRKGRTEEGVERGVAAFPVLGRLIGRIAGTMSGGEQKMLALARAYVQRPRILLLDEVSMGLAPKIVEDIFKFIGRLAKENVALLLVEQYVGKALSLADCVYVLGRGSIVLSGSPQEVGCHDMFDQYLGPVSLP